MAELYSDIMEGLGEMRKYLKGEKVTMRSETLKRPALLEAGAEKYGLREFDVAEFLDDEETIHAYLAETLKEGDSDAYLEALNDVERARQMRQAETAS